MLKFFKSKIEPYIQRSRIKPKSVNPEQSIFQSMKFFMVYAQILGVLPQENVLKNVKTMHFKWLSWHTMYSLGFAILLALTFASSVIYRLQNGGDLKDIAQSVFLAGGLAIVVIMIKLSKDWAKLMESWCNVDKIMNVTYGYPESLDSKIRLASTVYISLGIADFTLSIINQSQSLQYELEDNSTLQAYYNKIAPFVFSYISYHPTIGIIHSLTIAQATLSWALIDVFLIVLSISLALRFEQINIKLEKEKFDYLTESQLEPPLMSRENTITYWKIIREDYDRLACLCKELDSNISCIVLLSYFLNIFFLLVQLYYSLSYMALTINKVYFVFSFLYLIFKTVCVSLFAASINDQSKGPIYILNSVDSSVYNVEIRRLLTQISFDKVSLTGCKMFDITRGLILSVASAVVTYELVLIQFSTTNLYDDTNTK